MLGSFVKSLVTLVHQYLILNKHKKICLSTLLDLQTMKKQAQYIKQLSFDAI